MASKKNTTKTETAPKTETKTRKTRGPSKPAEFVATRVITAPLTNEDGTEAGPMSIELQPGQTAYITLPGASVVSNQNDAKNDLGAPDAVLIGQVGAVIRHSFGPETARAPKRAVRSVMFGS